MTAHLTQQRETASKCHGTDLIATADVCCEDQIAQEHMQNLRQRACRQRSARSRQDIHCGHCTTVQGAANDRSMAHVYWADLACDESCMSSGWPLMCGVASSESAQGSSVEYTTHSSRGSRVGLLELGDDAVDAGGLLLRIANLCNEHRHVDNGALSIAAARKDFIRNVNRPLELSER